METLSLIGNNNDEKNKIAMICGLQYYFNLR
jgi:hypothetical protein